MNGFFITISSSGGHKQPKLWRSELVDELKDWPVVKGTDCDDVLQIQKNLYHSRKEAQATLPRLVTPNEGPMASGKITRFVEVG